LESIGRLELTRTSWRQAAVEGIVFQEGELAVFKHRFRPREERRDLSGIGEILQDAVVIHGDWIFGQHPDARGSPVAFFAWGGTEAYMAVTPSRRGLRRGLSRGRRWSESEK